MGKRSVYGFTHDGELVVGQVAAGALTRNGKVTGEWSGTYDGQRVSEHPEGGQYHYFTAGQINGTAQRIFGFPVEQAAPTALQAAVEAVKAEIVEDVANGTVPADVPDFSALHSYVDANMYGGDAADALWDDALDHSEAGDVDPYAGLAAMQDAVDGWLKAGGLRAAAAPVICSRCGESVVYRPVQRGWVDTVGGDRFCLITAVEDFGVHVVEGDPR